MRRNKLPCKYCILITNDNNSKNVRNRVCMETIKTEILFSFNYHLMRLATSDDTINEIQLSR